MKEKIPPAEKILREHLGIGEQEARQAAQLLFAGVQITRPPMERCEDYEGLTPEEQGIIVGWNNANDVRDYTDMEFYLRDEQISRIQERQRQDAGRAD